MRNFPDLSKIPKEDLIEWIKRNHSFIRPPHLADFLFIQWEREAKQHLEAHQKLTEMTSQLDGKTQDELARQFNALTNHRERLEIANKMKPFYQKMEKIKREIERLDRWEQENNALLARIKMLRGEVE